MARSLREDSPFKMRVPSRRETLSGEARVWYDRVSGLEGRALNIRPHERTAFQNALDDLWRGVEALSKGEGADTAAMQTVYERVVARWSEELGDHPPRPDWPVTAPRRKQDREG